MFIVIITTQIYGNIWETLNIDNIIIKLLTIIII